MALTSQAIILFVHLYDNFSVCFATISVVNVIKLFL